MPAERERGVPAYREIVGRCREAHGRSGRDRFMFENVKIELPGKKNFTIETIHNSDENIYIQSVELNGKTYSKSYIQYEDIMKGGTLRFYMGNKPNYQFGAASQTRPFTPF